MEQLIEERSELKQLNETGGLIAVRKHILSLFQSVQNDWVDLGLGQQSIFGSNESQEKSKEKKEQKPLQKAINEQTNEKSIEVDTESNKLTQPENPCNQVFFRVISWPAMSDVLTSLGIHRELHITVGFKDNDIHHLPKDSSSLLEPQT